MNPMNNTRITLTAAERVAVAMLAAAAAQAAQRLNSPLLTRVMSALNYVEMGDIDEAIVSLSRPLR